MKRILGLPLVGAGALGVLLLGAHEARAIDPDYGWANAGSYSTKTSVVCTSSPLIDGVTCQPKTKTKAANYANYQWQVDATQGNSQSLLGPGFQFSGHFWQYIGVYCSDGSYHYTNWCSDSNKNYGSCWLNHGTSLMTINCPSGTTTLQGYGEMWATNTSNPPY